MLREILAIARQPLGQCQPLYETLSYMYESVSGRLRRSDGFVIKGLARDRNEKMTIMYVGAENVAHQIASLAYAQVQEFLPVKGLGSRDLSLLSAKNQLEIVMVQVKRPFARKFVEQGYLLLPGIRFVLDLRGSMDDMMKRMKRRRRRDIKRIKALNYSYAICKDNDKDFDSFYHKMYLPYAQNRFGKAALIRPYLDAKRIYESNGGVLLVKDGKKLLTGILFNIRRKTLCASCFGAYEGHEQLVEELAGGAALLCMIEWAKVQGAESLDYGVSLPLLREGVFTYKKEWGMSIDEHRHLPFTALRLNCLNECSLSFLQQNPFITIDEGEIKGVVFVDCKTTNAILKQIYSRHYLQNLRSLIVISYFKPGSETTHAIDSSVPIKPVNTLMRPLQNICLALQKKGFCVEAFEL